MRSLRLFLLLSTSCARASFWETSRIWPAINGVELYDDDNGANVLHMLRFSAMTPFLLVETSDHDDDRVHEILDFAYERFRHFLVSLLPKRSDRYPVNPDNKKLIEIANIAIQIRNMSSPLVYGIDESYELIVTQSSTIKIHGETVYGIVYGLETLKQIIQYGWQEDSTADPIFTLPGHVLIMDRPVYGYRGLMIDTARHFLPQQLILDNLELMLAHKMNVLHWHLTDSQSWPYQSERYPELSMYGSYCGDCIYSASDVKNIVEIAAKMGIRVIVEVDLPGHSQAIGSSHPELLSECGEHGPSEPLDVTQPSVYNFTSGLYDELTTLFPDHWIHIGGDEVDLRCWQNSEHIHDWMKLHNKTSVTQVLEYFEQWLVNKVESSYHRRPIAWQDLFDMGVNLPSSVILGVWKGNIFKETLLNATSDGYDVLVSACWYLDHLNLDWIALYRCNPRDFGNATLQQHVLGGHGSMWGETVDENDFWPRVWPRTSSVAEVLWSGSPTFNNTSPLDMRLVENRLDKFRCLLLQLFDVPIAPVRPGYCKYEDAGIADW